MPLTPVTTPAWSEDFLKNHRSLFLSAEVLV